MGTEDLSEYRRGVSEGASIYTGVLLLLLLFTTHMEDSERDVSDPSEGEGTGKDDRPHAG